ncbi:MAG: glycosyltransferase family 4 protein [Desulfobulbaceae bacterium]|nr:glycosyltransferase family 4 protein [Desulfobulbaceae bacterium]
MKIMHVTWGLSPGGTENLIVDVANEQAKSAIVTILIINDKVDNSLLAQVAEPVKILRINRKLKTKSIIDQLKIIAIILKHRPHILHLHHYGLYRLVKFAKLIGIPTCLTVHSTHYPCIDLDKHRHIFSISETTRLDLLKKCGAKATTITNGINCESIRKKGDTHWNSGEPFRIVQVGRLQHSVKGQHILLFALRTLIDDYQITNFTLDFIGTGESTDWLQGLTHKLQLQQHCRFLGEQSRATIYNNLADYHLLIQPSLFEGFGLTMIEAMTAKVPTLASDIDAPKEILQNGRLGFMFKNSNPNSLARQLAYLITKYNQTEIQNTIANAYSHTVTNFDVNSTAQKYLQMYIN